MGNYQNATASKSTGKTGADKSRTSNQDQIRDLVITAMFIALTYVFTAFVNVRLPIAANGGLIHLGNVPLFIGAIVFGKKTGAICGGVGMGLFDLLSGWTAWAPFTLVIVGLMGFAVGVITEKHEGFGWNALAIAVACIIKVVGYYIAEGFIYGNWIAPAASIPGNLIQIGVAAVLVLIIVQRLRVIARRMNLCTR
ncbi:MAG: ECF transporter S component [Lachnospiraceae bacterium]|nr:ECF transporter S component [Lachnospiraceae bacterium]MDD3616153.1 ECF transporter S component [Lachnospiraceae bacterium]